MPTVEGHPSAQSYLKCRGGSVVVRTIRDAINPTSVQRPALIAVTVLIPDFDDNESLDTGCFVAENR